MYLNQALIKQLKTDFKAYLYAAGHTEKTTLSYVRVVNPYLHWLAENNLPYLGLNYEQLLDYIKMGRQKGNKVNIILELSPVRPLVFFLSF